MKIHTITCEMIRKEKRYKIKATQYLGQFDIGHYCGYIEEDRQSLMENNKTVIGVFQSTNSPKEKITVETLHEEFKHFFRHED